MNIEKLFDAVLNDDMNSALGLICLELERQGYSIKIQDIEVTSEELFSGKSEYLEQYPGIYIFEIINELGDKQKFAVKFLDYHKFSLEKA